MGNESLMMSKYHEDRPRAKVVSHWENSCVDNQNDRYSLLLLNHFHSIFSGTWNTQKNLHDMSTSPYHIMFLQKSSYILSPHAFTKVQVVFYFWIFYSLAYLWILDIYDIYLLINSSLCTPCRARGHNKSCLYISVLSEAADFIPLFPISPISTSVNCSPARAQWSSPFPLPRWRPSHCSIMDVWFYSPSGLIPATFTAFALFRLR